MSQKGSGGGPQRPASGQASRPASGQSSRPASASSVQSNSSSRSTRSSSRAAAGAEHGPRLNEDVCISEEVKISINLAIHRFRMKESQTELEFPSSLTATERAYIHRLCDTLGLKHKSKGKHPNRYLTLQKSQKKAGSLFGSSAASFQLARNSRQQIGSMLQKFPVTNKERLELIPRSDKGSDCEVSRELSRTATGRLNNGVSQVPPPRGESDLEQFRETLPINKYKQQILHAINNNQVVLVAGETGSGKTTQVPQMILDDCHDSNTPCRIFCTQPRRIAALSIADRVAAERGEKIGQTVGFQIRLESRVSPKTLLTFCTNGVLLRTLMGCDNALNTVTHVFVDEVHERDKYSDFLLISLKELIMKQSNLKVILMSAALNIDLFVKFFNNCPVVCVPGSLFPVEEYFLEDVLNWTGYWSKDMDKFKKKEEIAARQREQLDRMCVNLPHWMEDLKTTADEEDEDEEAGGAHVDRDDLPSVLASLGQEKEELEPWVIKEMDQHLSELWLTGNEELFPQIFHLIAAENVSVDYQHSDTSISPLMIAASRGFTNIVEQLLNMGANAGLHASNDWTALDWAKKFNREEVIDMLEENMLTTEGSHMDAEVMTSGEDSVLTDADKELLNVYQHTWDDDKVDVDLVTSLIAKIATSQPEGAILVFLPGYDEIISIRDRINEDIHFENMRYVLFLLHSAMQSSDQKRVFKNQPHGVRKIILATNIAETSITINDVVYVIDAGKVKEKTYDALLSVTMLKSNWISKASALQRRGRAGRVQPGVCYHLFSKTRFLKSMSDYPTPELLRCPLQEICLQTKLLAGVDEPVSDFLSKAPEPPPFLLTRNAVQLLKQIDALDPSEDLTELGRHLADLPVEPHLGKMVLNSIVLKCLDPVLTIVCCLSYKDPFMIPAQPYQKRQVKLIKSDFAADTFSDHMALLRAFQAWQKARTDGWERSFCARNFLSSACMEMIVGIRAQLLGQLRASGFVRARGGGDIRDLNTNSENWAVVKAALCAGAFPNVIRINKKKKCLVTPTKERVFCHMGSVLPQKQGIKQVPSDWLFYEEKTRINQIASVRCCTVVSPITVAIFAGPAKLPLEALRDGSAESMELDGSMFPEDNSDSENEDKEDYKSSTLQLTDWLGFKVDNEAGSLAMQLRQKWHSLFLRRMRAPSKPWSQIDEAVIRAVVNVLTNEEQALGLQQPAGIGQRPKPMSAESIMSSGSISTSQTSPDDYMDASRQRFSTSAKKATSSPQKRRDYFSPKQSHSSDDSGTSQRGSGSSTPCGSPQLPLQGRQGDKDPGAGLAGPCRYFIMKCPSQNSIDMSVGKGTWSTNPSNESKLNKAFLDGKRVYLIFSVQGSGHFQGYAKMSSGVGEGSGQMGGFCIAWLKRANIPFQYTHHLLNPWNEGKRVQISRDGQELEPSVGEALLKLWDRYPDCTGQQQGSGAPMGGTGRSYDKLVQHSQKSNSPGQRTYTQSQSPRHAEGRNKQAGSYTGMMVSMAPGYGQGQGYQSMAQDQGHYSQGSQGQGGQQYRDGHYQQRQASGNHGQGQGHFYNPRHGGQGYGGSGQGYQGDGYGQGAGVGGVYQSHPGAGGYAHVGSGFGDVMMGRVQGNDPQRHTISPVMILQRGSNQQGFSQGSQYNQK